MLRTFVDIASTRDIGGGIAQDWGNRIR